MLVSLCRLNGRTGHLILLAGLVGFVVHCTVEITPSVPDVMWPFWGVVALAMAWNGSARPLSRRPLRRAIVSTVPFLAGAAALVVALLTVQPMRAVAVMHQAQRAVVQNDLESAVTLLRSAAAADSLDPLPLKAAAFLRYKLAQKDTRRAMEHYREYAELSRAAADRNPLDYAYWRSLGLANMLLGTATEDFALVDEAVGNMQRALELNPRWPVGWLELARMAAVEGNQPDRPALLQIAIDAANQALALDDARPREVPPSLKENERAELFAMRRQLDRRLRIAEARAAAATRSAR
jgi:tetratricopeptide (TPR) repeat protein